MDINVLFADDQHAVGREKLEIKERLKYSGLVEKYGLSMDFAATEERFLECIHAKKYDIIITCLVFKPGYGETGCRDETGYWNLEACRDLTGIRILRSTHGYKPEVKEEATIHGATHIMPKDADLLTELEKIIVKELVK